jgi:hypothetical protein
VKASSSWKQRWNEGWNTWKRQQEHQDAAAPRSLRLQTVKSCRGARKVDATPSRTRATARLQLVSCHPTLGMLQGCRASDSQTKDSSSNLFPLNPEARTHRTFHLNERALPSGASCEAQHEIWKLLHQLFVPDVSVSARRCSCDRDVYFFLSPAEL